MHVNDACDKGHETAISFNMTQQIQSGRALRGHQKCPVVPKKLDQQGKKTGKVGIRGNPAHLSIGCLTSANRAPTRQLRCGEDGPNGTKGMYIVICTHLCILVGWWPSWTTILQTITNATRRIVGCAVSSMCYVQQQTGVVVLLPGRGFRSGRWFVSECLEVGSDSFALAC